MSVGKVYALCLRLLADQELAEKLTVETYLITWRHISFFREDVLFSSWLTGITTHEILEWIRNNEKKWNDLDQKNIHHIKENINPKIVVPFEFSIQSLPSEERFVFVLHDVEKYTEDEVADLLSISKNNFKDILEKAYKLLKLPEEIPDREVYINSCLSSLPEVIQPEHDIWKYIFTVLNKELSSSTNSPDEQHHKPEGEIEKEGTKKKFGFLNWKKK
jgi:RNA polymerase sigma-70 factor (ECF subfamily)